MPRPHLSRPALGLWGSCILRRLRLFILLVLAFVAGLLGHDPDAVYGDSLGLLQHVFTRSSRGQLCPVQLYVVVLLVKWGPGRRVAEESGVSRGNFFGVANSWGLIFVGAQRFMGLLYLVQVPHGVRILLEAIRAVKPLVTEHTL